MRSAWGGPECVFAPPPNNPCYGYGLKDVPHASATLHYIGATGTRVPATFYPNVPLAFLVPADRPPVRPYPGTNKFILVDEVGKLLVFCVV